MKTHSASSSTTHTCKIRLFRDEDSLLVNFQKNATGEWLLEHTCNELNLAEKYYFGLRYTDQHSRRQWLELSKPLLKQVKDPLKDSICFRVRYYPAAPELLHEELTKYQLYMQLRRDTFHGRLVPRLSDVPGLCALIIQSELGDHDDLQLDEGFTKDVDLLPKIAASMEDSIIKVYKELSGLTPADTETRFIDRVKSLETYGIDPQPAKDKTGEMLHVGASHVGVSVFQSFKRIKLFKWEALLKCTIDGKYVAITVLLSEGEEKLHKHTYKYKCPDEATAKFLWTNILDQQAFFTLHSTTEAKPVKSGGLFRRSNTFRFSGQCYDEVIEASSKIARMPPDFVRASSTSLNRSLSIRNSKRHLVLPSKRYSTGSSAISHSKSLPVDFCAESVGDDSLVQPDEVSSVNVSDGCIAEVQTPPSTPVLSDKMRNPDEINKFFAQPMNDTTDVDTANCDLWMDSTDDYVDSANDPGHLLTATIEDDVVPELKIDPLFASTPASKPVSEGAGHPESLRDGDTAKLTSDQSPQLNKLLGRENPRIIITDDDDGRNHWKADEVEEGGGGDIDQEAPQANGDVAMPSENGGEKGEPCQQETLTQIYSAATPPVELVDEPIDPLSESTREKLKLDLKQLDETSSEEASPISSPSTQPSSHSMVKSLLKAFLGFTLVVLLTLLVAAYILFESDYASLELDKIRHLRTIEHIEQVYYRPVRQIIVNLVR